MENIENQYDNNDHFKLIIDISEIKVDDVDVQVVGVAKEINKSQEFKITDETGSFSIREIPDSIKKIEEEGVYRVYGTVSIDGAGTPYIASKFVQQLEDFDIVKFKKVLQLKREIA